MKHNEEVSEEHIFKLKFCMLNNYLWTELSRLLKTAKDEDRKELIRKAITALDSSEGTAGVDHDKFNVHMNPSIHASIYGSQNVSEMNNL